MHPGTGLGGWSSDPPECGQPGWEPDTAEGTRRIGAAPNSRALSTGPPPVAGGVARANSVMTGRGPAAVAGTHPGSTQKGGADDQTVSPHSPPHPRFPAISGAAMAA